MRQLPRPRPLRVTLQLPLAFAAAFPSARRRQLVGLSVILNAARFPLPFAAMLMTVLGAGLATPPYPVTPPSARATVCL